MAILSGFYFFSMKEKFRGGGEATSSQGQDIYINQGFFEDLQRGLSPILFYRFQKGLSTV